MPESGAQILPEPSWDLCIYVPELQVEKFLRVRGDMHIGGVMLKLVEELDVLIDWSDHAFWWPKSNLWLSKTRQTLNQLGVQADSYLNFTPMHKRLRLQLPDLRHIDARVDFSVPCFEAVKLLCKELGIRHSEELSFCRPLSAEHLKRNYQNIKVTPGQRTNYSSHSGVLDCNFDLAADSSKSLGAAIDTRSHSPDIASTISRHASYRGFTTTYSTTMLAEDLKNLGISNNPHSMATESARNSLLYPKSIAEKARLNSSWLDSHLSLYQQNVRDFDTLQLRFKFRAFYDLNAKLDVARINQLYEQAKWSLQTEEVECSEDELRLFHALSYQIEQSSSDFNEIAQEMNNATNDDIDAALTELQLQLEGCEPISFAYEDKVLFARSTQRPLVEQMNSSVVSTLELCDWIRFMRVEKLTLKTFKRLLFVLRDTTLSAYRNEEERARHEATLAIDLRGCDLMPDVCVQLNKYGCKLPAPGFDGLSKFLLRFDDVQQYARWMAALKLASRGQPVTKPTYEHEIRALSEAIKQQQQPPTSQHFTRIDDYATTRRYARRVGRTQATRILETYAQANNLSATELKLSYIKAWRKLPDHDVHMFVVLFGDSTSEQILGIAPDRLVSIDASTGEHLQVWPYTKMKTWSVNWNKRQFLIQTNRGEISFACLSANCKIVHEFIGGYVVLSMRSKENNQTLNEPLFYKLTKGWHDVVT